MPTYVDSSFGDKFVFDGSFRASDTCCGGTIELKITMVLPGGTFMSKRVTVDPEKHPGLVSALKSRRALPCIHRSEEPIERSSCGKYNVYECDEFDKCVMSRHPRTDPTFASCSDCVKYTATNTS